MCVYYILYMIVKLYIMYCISYYIDYIYHILYLYISYTYCINYIRRTVLVAFRTQWNLRSVKPLRSDPFNGSSN